MEGQPVAAAPLEIVLAAASVEQELGHAALGPGEAEVGGLLVVGQGLGGVGLDGILDVERGPFGIVEGAHERAGADVAGLGTRLELLEGGPVAVLAGLVEQVEIELLVLLAVGGLAPLARGLQQREGESGQERDRGLGQDQPGEAVARIRVPERRVRPEPVGPDQDAAHDLAFM